MDPDSLLKCAGPPSYTPLCSLQPASSMRNASAAALGTSTTMAIPMSRSLSEFGNWSPKNGIAQTGVPDTMASDVAPQPQWSTAATTAGEPGPQLAEAIPRCESPVLGRQQSGIATPPSMTRSHATCLEPGVQSQASQAAKESV
eukprot:CAMPEP_0179145618 /NCGR_PEP_ID=MMETSP0796-20121207/70271_1 /TAXON_ID=73915 /ORGANISM="Pyrodinium bahamense, Strain pbaha01" /LENGTH=143 /DNA_ID=CAMNT_0020846031 /DNA_START=393 /DNA_END=825 /DNA_ORIENTATION=-